VFEWVLDPDGNPRTDDAPSVINGSWDDGEPGAARRSSTPTSLPCAPPASSRVRRGQRGPAAATGASPASAPGAVAVGSVREATSSRCSRDAALAVRKRRLPHARRLRRGHLDRGPWRIGGRLRHVVRGTAGDRRGRAAGRDVPGRHPGRNRGALVRGARDVGRREPTPTRAPASSTSPGCRAARRRRPRGSARDDHGSLVTRFVAPGLVVFGRAHERGGGRAQAWPPWPSSDCAGARRPVRAHGHALRRDGLSSRALLVPRQVRRLEDGRHSLFVRARDAAGNWGPGALVVLRRPPAPAVRASGRRRGDLVSATLSVRERDSGLRCCAIASRWQATRTVALTRAGLAGAPDAACHARRHAILRVLARTSREREAVGVHDPALSSQELVRSSVMGVDHGVALP
jgi:hypothetical protein